MHCSPLFTASGCWSSLYAILVYATGNSLKNALPTQKLGLTGHLLSGGDLDGYQQYLLDAHHAGNGLSLLHLGVLFSESMLVIRGWGNLQENFCLKIFI